MFRIPTFAAAAAFLLSSPAFSQPGPVRPVQPTEVRPGIQLRQPSNFDLQLRILDLSRQVEALSEQVAALNSALIDRIAQVNAARRDQIEGVANSLREFRRLEKDRFAVTMRTAYAACFNAAIARSFTGSQAIHICQSDEFSWPGQSLVVD